jgi:phosphoribosylamine--glycine ligase
MTPAMTERVMAEIIRPTLSGMAKRGTPFQGVLFAGLMITAEGPKLIEYNTRFGDPECEVLMPRLKSDLVPALIAACDGLLGQIDLRWREEAALTVVLAAKGYPGSPETGSVIRGVEKAETLDDVLVFHAGTKLSNGDLLANGGRVLNVVGLGQSVAEAQARAYAAVDRIDWPEGFCRRDIGWQAVKREQG